MLPLLVKMPMKWSLKELFLTNLSEIHLLNINNCSETDLRSIIKMFERWNLEKLIFKRWISEMLLKYLNIPHFTHYFY